MAYAHRTVAVTGTEYPGRKATSKADVSSVVSPQRVMPLTRSYEVQYLASNSNVDQFRMVAPATPVFEEAFSAFARGALIATTQGLRAVEDLMPGDLIETSDAGPQPLLWVGNMTLFPDMDARIGETATSHEPDQMFRITADTFGLDRPAPDLMLGPRARLLFKHSGCRSILNSDAGFAPLRAFCDGVSVTGISPMSRQKVFHLAFAKQHCIIANGLELESFHPGEQPQAMMARDMQHLFLALFPHLDSFDGFGKILYPRLTAFELENLRAA